MKFCIISDSSLDLPEEKQKELNVDVIPFYVSFDSENYYREGIDIKIREFYKRMVDNPDVFPKTSMPSVTDYLDVFEKYAKQNIPVLCICLNAALSGSYQAAVNAANMIKEQYPETEIAVVDSELVTLLQGLFVEEAVKMRDMDYSLEETISVLDTLKPTGRIFFTTNDLAYLQHGGRIGHAASSIGTALKIKPLIEYKDKDIYSAGVCRGRKKSLERILERLMNYISENHLDMDEYRLAIACGWDEDEFKKFEEEAFDKMRSFGYAPENWETGRVGVTIGVHTGPYPIGVGILKKFIPSV